MEQATSSARSRSRETATHTRGASVPRALFLLAAALSFALSVILFFSGDEMEGIFVGLWVPSILALGAFLAPRAPERSSAEERR